jgi:hypothetical protein
MSFLAKNGFTMEKFRKRALGPVVLEDKLVYKKELKLLENFSVDLALLAMARAGRRMKGPQHLPSRAGWCRSGCRGERRPLVRSPGAPPCGPASGVKGTLAHASPFH